MTQKSSDQLLESLSALVDNEASELEVRRILKNVELNPEVRERWHRYNMIGAVLRKETNLHLSEPVDLAAGISAALASEQSFGQPIEPAGTVASSPSEREPGGSHPKSRGWFDFIAKSAVAASFAGALVLGFNVFGPGTEGGVNGPLQLADSGQRPQAADPVVNSAPIGFDLPPLESRTVGSNPLVNSRAAMRSQALSSGQADDLTDVATQNLLNELLIHHASRASSNGSLGVMPFARVSQLHADEDVE